MARLLPDPTFYPSPTMAATAPTEQLAYVALLATGDNGKKGRARRDRYGPDVASIR